MTEVPVLRPLRRRPCRAPVTTLTRPALPFALVLLAVAAGCAGSGPSPTPPATRRSPSPAAVSPPATMTLPPDGASASPAASPGQTDTEFGRIWDALPPGFPEPRGAAVVPVEPDLPASGAWDVQAPVNEVAALMQAALEEGNFSTESMSGPLEDDSIVIESVGPSTTDCRVQTTIAPLGGLTRVTILYGAACPFG